MSDAAKAALAIQMLNEAVVLKGELPCMASTLSRIAVSMQSANVCDGDLVDVVLSDFALAQKVLRLANSPMYSHFGGVTTISMAVYVLGTDALGHLAMGVKLLEDLGNAIETEVAREELSKAVIASAVARAVAMNVAGKDGEAVAVATLMRSLGRLMVCFYLPEQFSQIEALRDHFETEDSAAREVLGLGFSDIANELAKSWRLPAALESSTRELENEASENSRWTFAVSSFSRSYVEALARGSDEVELRAVADRYSSSVGPAGINLAAQASRAVAAVHSIENVACMWDHRRKVTPATKSRAYKLKRSVDELERTKEQLTPTQMLGMATEVLWESLGCRNALLFVRNQAKQIYEVAIARGKGMQRLVRKVTFSADFAPNVVHLALNNGSPVYLANPNEQTISRRIPTWVPEHTPSPKAIFLLPIQLNGRPQGVLYLDWSTGATLQAFTAEEQSEIERLRKMTTDFLERSGRKPAPTTILAI